jgi:hypothetical protein
MLAHLAAQAEHPMREEKRQVAVVKQTLQQQVLEQVVVVKQLLILAVAVVVAVVALVRVERNRASHPVCQAKKENSNFTCSQVYKFTSYHLKHY